MVLGGDAAGLAELAIAQQWGCEVEEWSPRCKPGQQPGEVVEVFPDGACEPSWMDFADVPQLFEALAVQPPERLYAAYRSTGPDDWLADEYVFERGDGLALVVVVIENGISTVHNACSNRPQVIVDGLRELGPATWIVPPPD